MVGIYWLAMEIVIMAISSNHELIEGTRRRGRQRTRWLDGIIGPKDMSLSKLWEMVKDRKSGLLQSIGLQRAGHD